MAGQISQVRRSYIDGPFGQLHLRIAKPPKDTGKPALMCFHMSPMSGRIYENFLAAMGTDRVAIAPDMPGYGASDAPPSPPEIIDYSKAMAHAIDVLGLSGPVDVMGYHTGAKVALELAILRPQQIRRLVLISATIFTDAERQAFREHYGPKTPTTDGSHLAALWRSFLFHNLRGGLTIDDVADAFPDMLLGRNNSWCGHRAAFNHYPDQRLPMTDKPILMFNPNDDLREYTPRAAPFLRNGRIIDLPSWGHGFLDGSIADAAALVRSFLDAPDADPFGRLVIPVSDGATESTLPGHFASVPSQKPAA
jgi:pimeloyl-ACP methyl ester carboxylesterase